MFRQQRCCTGSSMCMMLLELAMMRTISHPESLICSVSSLYILTFSFISSSSSAVLKVSASAGGGESLSCHVNVTVRQRRDAHATCCCSVSSEEWSAISVYFMYFIYTLTRLLLCPSCPLHDAPRASLFTPLLLRAWTCILVPIVSSCVCVCKSQCVCVCKSQCVCVCV